MSANEKQITDLNDELTALAATVETESLSLAQTIAAIDEANEEIETRKANALLGVANLRVPEGSKLIYTNDDGRKSKLILTLAADADYQAFIRARSRLAETAAMQKAAIEKNRNLHRAKLLVLQYYANLP